MSQSPTFLHPSLPHIFLYSPLTVSRRAPATMFWMLTEMYVDIENQTTLSILFSGTFIIRFYYNYIIFFISFLNNTRIYIYNIPSNYPPAGTARRLCPDLFPPSGLQSQSHCVRTNQARKHSHSGKSSCFGSDSSHHLALRADGGDG